jgi:hypothetical protein
LGQILATEAITRHDITARGTKALARLQLCAPLLVDRRHVLKLLQGPVHTFRISVTSVLLIPATGVMQAFTRTANSAIVADEQQLSTPTARGTFIPLVDLQSFYGFWSHSSTSAFGLEV